MSRHGNSSARSRAEQPSARIRLASVAGTLRALAVLVVLVLGGCSGSGEGVGDSVGDSVGDGVGGDGGKPSEAAGREVTIEGLREPILVEVARTEAEQARGLMGRTEVPEGTGMLFAWAAAEPRSFWMRDTLVPLDIAWILDGRIVGVDTMAPCTTAEPEDCERFPSPGPVDAALEVAAGGLAGVESGAAVVQE